VTLIALKDAELAFGMTPLLDSASLALFHGHEGPAHELMRSADQQLTGKSIEEIFDLGLHQFLGHFIVRNQAVATAIAEQYRFTV